MKILQYLFICSIMTWMCLNIPGKNARKCNVFVSELHNYRYCRSSKVCLENNTMGEILQGVMEQDGAAEVSC